MNFLRAIDVASWQPRDLTQLIARHQVQHAIIRLYLPWESVPWDHTAAQVRSARDNAISVGGYAWAYRSISPEATIKAVITRCAEIGLVLPLLWLDCETYKGPNGTIADPGPDADWLARAVACAEDQYGMACGLYTGAWWIEQYFPGGADEFAKFSRLPLWIADYDGDPSLETATIPKGWASVAAKQYADKPIDLDSIRAEYTVYTPSTPAPDACSGLRDGLAALINRKPFRVKRRELEALLG